MRKLASRWSPLCTEAQCSRLRKSINQTCFKTNLQVGKSQLGPQTSVHSLVPAAPLSKRWWGDSTLTLNLVSLSSVIVNTREGKSSPNRVKLLANVCSIWKASTSNNLIFTCTRGAFLVWQWCYGSGAQWMWQCSPNQGGNSTKGHPGQILETIGNRVPYLLIITWRQHNSCNESCQFWKAIIICHKGTLHSEVVMAPSGAQDTLTSSWPAVQLPKSKMSI